MTQRFLPNEADAFNANQAEPDSVDFEILLLGYQRTGVISGCVVTEDPVTPDMTVDVTAGEVVETGEQISVSEQLGNAVTAADGSNPRIDLVSINGSGSVVVTAGTAAAQPVMPAVPATSIPLATLYVPTSDTSIEDNQINDKRVFVDDLGVFNVKHFGATGDGTTDDTTPVQAAIDAAEVSAGEVFFPQGSYSINCTVNSDKVTLTGVGPGTILLSDDGTNPIITFENVDFCGMRDFFLEGEWAGVVGLRLDGCRWSMFSNITGDQFTDAMIDLRTDINATQNTANNTFTHVHALNCIRFIRFQSDAGLTRPVTLNQFFNVSAVGAGTVLSTLIDFSRGADNNFFMGVARLSLNFAGSIGVVYNSDSPAATRAVYENHFLGTLIIDQDVAATISLDINDCTVSGASDLYSRIKYRAGGTNPTVPDVADNGFVTWLDPLLLETSAATTLDLNHGLVNVDTSGGAVVITLPDNADARYKSYLIRRDGASIVTINRAGTDTFDDADIQKTLDSDSAAIGIFSIGDGEWKIVAMEGTVGGS